VEELWAFNEEIVARAVYASKVPVVSGVGHETDTTIIDYVADLRAPTPSAAAELANPDRAELALAVEGYRRLIVEDIEGRLAVAEDALDQEIAVLARLSPERQVLDDRQRLNDMLTTMTLRLEHAVALNRERVSGSKARLEALSPLQILKRGYAIVRDLDTGKVVSGIQDTQPDHLLEIRVSDGAFGARTESVKRKE